jgi:hypothetical protein
MQHIVFSFVLKFSLYCNKEPRGCSDSVQWRQSGAGLSATAYCTYLYLSASNNPTFFQHGKSLLLVVSNKNPPASAVATDSVADVIVTVGFPRVLSVAVVSAVAGIPAAIVLLLFLPLFSSQEYTCCG